MGQRHADFPWFIPLFIPLFLKNLALSGIDKGSNVMVRLIRPKNAVLFKIFSSIQVDTDPQKTTTMGIFCLSHQTLSLGIKLGSLAPIQEISSKRTISPIFRCRDRCSNASLQSWNVRGGIFKKEDVSVYNYLKDNLGKRVKIERIFIRSPFLHNSYNFHRLSNS